jgi:hypothetical protein
VKRGSAYDLERILRILALAGASTFLGSLAVAAVGTVTGALTPFYGNSLRFLVAVLVLTAPYAEFEERRARRTRRVPADERLGFARDPAS